MRILDLPSELVLLISLGPTQSKPLQEDYVDPQ